MRDLEPVDPGGDRVRIGDDHRSQMQVGADGAVIVADVRGERHPPAAGLLA